MAHNSNSPSEWHSLSALKKTTLEEWRGAYVGGRAQPTPPHMPVLFSRLTFFQWSYSLLFGFFSSTAGAQAEIEGIVSVCGILTAIHIMHLNGPERLSCVGKYTV